MIADLSPAADRALQSAKRYAHCLQAAEVEPLHLLQGLLEEEESPVADLLTNAGLKVAILKHNLGSKIAGAWTGEPPEVPLGKDVEAVINLARRLTWDLTGDSSITSTAVLLALIRQNRELRLALESHGLDHAHLEREAAALQGPPLLLEEPLDLDRPAEEFETARILDANFNRAREALRVVEDYCRFVLDDAFLSGQLKSMRHDLAEVMDTVPATLLLESRDTLHDVGTRLTTLREEQRASPLAVVQANLKRLHEALRSLEEFGKLRGPEVGRELESLRYRSYTLERAILLGMTSRQRLEDTRLYVLITGSLCSAALDWTIQEAAAGGVGMVQLREKDLSDRCLLERARQVRQWTRRLGVLFILNDRPDLARLTEADGVHLGQEDLPLKEARRILGPDALIGVSTHDLNQVRQAVLDGANYLGVGPAFPSSTKEFSELAGLDFVRQSAAETSLPAFVIGGVNRDTIDAAVQAGAKRVAVSAAICQAENPRAMAAELLQRLGSGNIASKRME